METMKGTPDARLERLVEALGRSLEGNLRSVVLYGSAARGEHAARTSDLSVMVEVADGSPERLEPAAPVQRRWIRDGNPPLLLVTSEWIRDSTDVFPLEFQDMLAAHKVLRGEDPLGAVTVSPANLRHQCEYEIRSIVLKLRAGYLDAFEKAGRLFDLIVASHGSVATVARAALRLAGEEVPPRSDEVFDAVAKRLGLDPAPLHEVAALKREGRAVSLARMKPLFLGYFAQILALGRALDAMKPGGGAA
jgi:hypothetical protein